MERTPVESSQIKSVGYDPTTHVLEVEFVPRKDGTPGAIYQYDDVPAEIAEQLVAAQSVGRYFKQFVKFGFKYHKVEPPKPEPQQQQSGADEEDIPF